MPDDKTAAPSAEVGKGAKKIRTVYKGDRFEIDKNTVITGEPTEFAASKVKAIVDAAAANRVGIIVTDA